jgi:hypothetical protein
VYRAICEKKVHVDYFLDKGFDHRGPVVEKGLMCNVHLHSSSGCWM